MAKRNQGKIKNTQKVNIRTLLYEVDKTVYTFSAKVAIDERQTNRQTGIIVTHKKLQTLIC